MFFKNYHRHRSSTRWMYLVSFLMSIGALNKTDAAVVDISLTNLFPRFLHAFPSGPVVNLAPPDEILVNCTLRYRSLGISSNETIPISWWELTDIQRPDGKPTLEILSDNVPAISTLSSYGIIGLYVAVVFAISRFIRILITDLTLRIMYEDLPNPDPVLKVCSDTILAREFRDFETEETLYWQLITLFRSPQRLLTVTRFKQD
jgi:hypothetical protein